MPSLGAKERSALPNSAFAYIDSTGRRRAADPRRGARSQRARAVQSRPFRGRRRARPGADAAPEGGQEARDHAARVRRRPAPAGAEAPARAGHVPAGGHRGLDRAAAPARRRVRRRAGPAPPAPARGRPAAGGREIDARGDEFFGVFERPTPPLDAAIAIQRRLRDHAWPDGVELGSGSVSTPAGASLNETGYIGLAVHTVARVCTAGTAARS